ncbi:MAG: retroviral-like aspartic protease family protein [Acidobacteria bacterium]|nr:retroviral-like aspartic protease family protein [Acidobacteriota bacterium]
MPALRCVVLSLAAIAAVSTFGIRVAGQADSADPAAHFQLATEFYDSARYREALGAYDQAVRTGDTALTARARKGKVRTALRIAEFDLARAEAETLNAGDAPDAESKTLLGDALWGSGLFDEADTAYTEALALEPESSRARFGRARSLASTSQLDEALEEARAIAASAPRDPEVHALVALVYERMHRYEESADAYERYMDLLPRSENGAMVALAQNKLQLLRSFGDRVPLEVEGDPGRVYRVPFRMVDTKIVLKGRVNRAAVEFVLDTGSEQTGISAPTARTARIRPVTATFASGVGVPGMRRREIGRADVIEVGELRIRNVPVSIRELEPGGLPQWQTESFSPLSAGFSVVVDYARQEALFSRALPDGEADVRLPMRMNRLPLVRGLLNSSHPAYFVVDTGGELISISADTALALAMPPVRRIPLRVVGMSGEDANAFLLPGVDLDFNEIAYRQVGLAVLNLRAPSVLLGYQIGGIVGHSFLSDYRVSVDIGRSEVRLERF